MRDKVLLILILALNVCLSSVLAQTPKPPIGNGAVINGKALSLPKPPYPTAALAVKASGAVNVRVTINESGDVTAASAVSGHPLLRGAAEQAARQAKFAPTKLSGQPVKVTGIIVYNFVPAVGKLLWASVSSFLTIAAKNKWNPAAEKYITDYASILLTAFPDEKMKLFSLLEKQGANHTKVFGDVLDSLENKLVDSDVWEIQLGRSLGEVIFESRNQIAKTGYQLNEENLRKNLWEIGKLIGSAPSEVSTETAAALKQIADYADAPDLKTSENLVGISEGFTEFLKGVSSNAGK